MDNQLIVLEQKALQSMMNPHFIFNAFSSIQNYLHKKRPEEAELYVGKFARLIRKNLNSINSNVVKLDDEISRIRDYLELEQLRMENKFEFSIELNGDFDEESLLIPSMIIQPFVENAVWHGISSIGNNGMVNISFGIYVQGSITITIEDNGVGIKNARGKHFNSERHLNMGTEMTRKRVALLGKKFGVKTSVNYFEMFPGSSNPGTRVVLVVPAGYRKEIW
jgi:LytS/YehU family sensor histidine kinase